MFAFSLYYIIGNSRLGRTMPSKLMSIYVFRFTRTRGITLPYHRTLRSCRVVSRRVAGVNLQGSLRRCDMTHQFLCSKIPWKVHLHFGCRTTYVFKFEKITKKKEILCRKTRESARRELLKASGNFTCCIPCTYFYGGFGFFIP